VPTNFTRRADRIEAWNEARQAGLRFLPERATGRDARYRWIDAIVTSDLSSTSRLLAHSLVLHGQSNGERIFPSVRRLANDAALSERAVCQHLDTLVRRGFLLREARNGNTAGAKGFKYLLMVPRVLTDDQHHHPAATASRASVLTQVQHSDSVLTDGQHSVDRVAPSADGNSNSVLTVRQPIQLMIQKSINPESARAPVRALEGARAQEEAGAQRVHARSM
jgi:hypothetical protein